MWRMAEEYGPNKFDRIWSVLDKNKPDIVCILESALTETEKARTFHDKY